nr:hypothetical protein [Tanacetum cinerariifolium]
LDTSISVRRPKNRGVIWKKKRSSSTSNATLSAVSDLKLNKNVKRMCDLLDDNNFFIFDDESVKISPVNKMPFRKKPYDSMNIDSLLDEFADELTLHKSIPPGIDETDCHPENEICLSQRLLYDNSYPCPPKEFVSENSNADIESFSPSPIMEEIDLTFTPDDPMPPSIKEDDDDSRDILIHEELLDNYSLLIPENEYFHFDVPLSSRPPAKPPDDNTGILNIKMMGDVSDQKFPIPELMIILEDDDDSRDTLIRKELFDNYSLSIPENESFHFDIPLSSRHSAKPPDGNTRILNAKMMGDVSDHQVPIPELTITLVSNQEKSPDLLSHRGLENFQPSAECPMKIHGKNIPTLDVP